MAERNVYFDRVQCGNCQIPFNVQTTKDGKSYYPRSVCPYCGLTTKWTDYTQPEPDYTLLPPEGGSDAH